MWFHLKEGNLLLCNPTLIESCIVLLEVCIQYLRYQPDLGQAQLLVAVGEQETDHVFM